MSASLWSEQVLYINKMKLYIFLINKLNSKLNALYKLKFKMEDKKSL